jgi:hypothetical protein
MYKPSKNWSIEKGDYKRDDDATWSHHRKQRRYNVTKKIVLIIFYSLGVSGLTYFALTML